MNNPRRSERERHYLEIDLAPLTICDRTLVQYLQENHRDILVGGPRSKKTKTENIWKLIKTDLMCFLQLVQENDSCKEKYKERRFSTT
jgi:hypothetical protein